MKEKLFKIITNTRNWLQKVQRWLDPDKNDFNVYTSLSPIDNADKENHYCNALSWALDNRVSKDIKNIAITGPYGSGKSSILKTFQKKYSSPNLHFLNISLATFKEEIVKEKNSNDSEILRLIELSILQQIFYHEEDKKIPDSRFKKIKHYSIASLTIVSICLSIFLVAVLNLYDSHFIQNLLKDTTFSDSARDYIHYSSYLIIFVGTFLILFKSIRILNSITISTLKIQNAEIELENTKSNKSILNHHLDEILYFFEVTQYNVVVIEDLDRFRETEIFTKLREINLLLNESKKTRHKNIVFIYAVRDEMFKDKDRTKFFDFIIPVIPVINSSNSNQILLDKSNYLKYELSEDLINDMSLFIDDMRLLHNIINEFHIYKALLDKNLVQDKLMAILVYKNIYPTDFIMLGNNEGDLLNALNAKEKVISSQVLKIDSEIESIVLEINTLEQFKLLNLKELRSLYILKLISNLEKFNSFVINNEIVSIDQLAEDDYFDYFIKDKLFYRQWVAAYSYQFSTQDIQVKKLFNQIEKQVDNKNYEARKKEIDDWHLGKIDILKTKIESFENEKTKIKSFRIKDLLVKNSIPLSELSDTPLIKVLLRNGYIDEDYHDYISIFYEGSLTKNDNQFLLCLKSQQKLPSNFKLQKIDKIIKKIHPTDFTSPFILNHDLLDYIIQTPKEDIIKHVFSKLKDESSESISFIDEYIERGIQIDAFIQHLCSEWKKIWKYINQESNFSDIKKENYFKMLIQYSKSMDLSIIAIYSDLKNTIATHHNFLNLIKDEKRLKDIIKSLKIKFSILNFEKSPSDLLNFIYENNHYTIDVEMIRSILKFKNKFNASLFENSNYNYIQECGCPELIDYIQQNIDKYIESLYLKIDTNVNEIEKSFVLLVNNDKIELENRKKIIEKVNTRIVNLSEVNNNELKKFISHTK